MSRFKFASEHSLAKDGVFEDLHPKSAREAGRNSSFTVERAAADLLTTNSQKENTMNIDIDAMAFGDRIDVGTTNRSCVSGTPPLNTENGGKPKSTIPPLSDSGLDNWERNLVIPSYDRFCSYLENQEKFSASWTSIPGPRTSTPDSFLERKQKLKESRGIYEMDSKSKARKSRTTIASSGFPPADDLNTDRVKSRVMVLDKSNRSRINWEEELRPYLQTKPKTTPQNQRDTKAIDPNPDVEKNKHFSKGGGYLNSLESNRKISMVETRIDNDVFFAYHDVLSQFSSYFAELFSKRSEKCQLPMIIRVSGISSEVFRVFLDFAYGRKFAGNSNTLEELIKMADVFSIPVMKDHCLKLLDEISLENAVQILRDKRYPPSSSGLFAFLVSRISEEFQQLYNSVEFYELDVSIVCRILSNDNIQIATEMDVFKVALKWISHSMNERRQYLSRVMSCVRFHCITQDELFECVEINDWMKKCFEMKKLIMHANWVITAGILKRGDPFDVPASPERTCFRETRPHFKKKSSAFFNAQVLPDVRVDVEAFYSPTEETTAKNQNQNPTAGQQYGDVCGNQQRRKYFEKKQGGRIFISGGISTEAKIIVQSVKCYDVTKDVWVTNIQDVQFPTG